MAANAPLRPFHMSARCSSSCGLRTSIAPHAVISAIVSCAVSSTSAAMPSTSISSAARRRAASPRPLRKRSLRSRARPSSRRPPGRSARDDRRYRVAGLAGSRKRRKDRSRFFGKAQHAQPNLVTMPSMPSLPTTAPSGRTRAVEDGTADLGHAAVGKNERRAECVVDGEAVLETMRAAGVSATLPPIEQTL